MIESRVLQQPASRDGLSAKTSRRNTSNSTSQSNSRQEEQVARAMLPGVPARELQDEDVRNNADAVHENHERMGLTGLPRAHYKIR